MKRDKKDIKNPAFRNEGLYEASETPVTKRGVTTKVTLLLFVVLMAALVTAYLTSSSDLDDSVYVLAIASIVLTLGLSFAIIYKPHLAKPLGFVYAVVEGFLLGVISMGAVAAEGGRVVALAIAITFTLVLVTNLLYTFGIIKVNRQFVSIVFMMTAAAFVFYMVLLIGSFVGLDTGFLYDGSPLAIGLSVAMLFIASLNLFADYYLLDEAITIGADKEYEWYLAFGIVLTVVWIYLEALRFSRNILNR